MQKTTFNHLSRDLWNNECVDLKMVVDHPAPQLFQEKINYKFSNSQLLLEMLCHSSFANEFGITSNERLEFLGDTVLALLVSSELLGRFVELPEGELSKLRGALVNETILAELARSIDLGAVMLLGKGEAASGGYEKDGLLADFFEAMLGAIYVDSGFTSVKSVFDSILTKYNENSELTFFSIERLNLFDPKSRLQELTMSLFKELPRYEVEEEGEIFKVSLFIKDKFIDSVAGPSKKKATRELARKVLQEKTYAS